MISYIEIGGEKRPVSYSISTVRQLAVFRGCRFEDAMNSLADSSIEKLVEFIYCGFIVGSRKEGKSFDITLDEFWTWLDDTDKMEELMRVVTDSMPDGTKKKNHQAQDV